MDIKAGYKTSEFWVTAIVTLLTSINASGALGFTIPIEAITPIVAMAASYVLGRSIAKKA